MDVERVRNPIDFLRDASALLLADEARHNLALGIVGGLARDSSRPDRVHLWLVRDRGVVVGAAFMTEPHHLFVARPAAEGVVEALAGTVARQGLALPGVVGALPEAEEFAAAWAGLAGVGVRRHMAQGIYRCASARPVPGVPGAAREAGPADRGLLLEWVGDFAREAGTLSDPESVRRTVDSRLAGSSVGFVLWEDDEPVSLSGYGGATPNGIRIGPVWTPPVHRRRGYASAVVSGLTARLLREGRRFCFLYTDLSNATSNHIYREIGYEFVCRSAELSFEEDPSPTPSAR